MRQLLILLLLLPGLVSAAVYRSTDPDGVPLFSDKPQKGAKKIKLQPAQTYTPPEVPSMQQHAMPEQKKAVSLYKKVSIAHPANETTFRDPSGRVDIAVDLTPPLSGDDKLQILVDGRVVAESYSTQVSVEGLVRGSHIIQAKVIAHDGSVIAMSQVITVYMHPPRINMIAK